MLGVFRYRTKKPDDGHFSFDLHRDAVVVGFVEGFHVGDGTHAEKGWEVNVDCLVDTSLPTERKFFFLCNAGTDLSVLGGDAAYHILEKSYSKSYAAYLFDVTHLSETERNTLVANKAKLARPRPAIDEMSTTEKKYELERLRKVREPVRLVKPPHEEAS